MRSATEASKRARERGRDRERGAALVEFALVIVPLCVILFGIIWFGVLLSFKQAVTQAAAEGARAAVPFSYTTAGGPAAAMAAAEDATDRPLSSWNRSCSSAGATCTFTPEVCPNDPDAYCMSVTVSYDYDTNPLLPNLPLLSQVLPDRIASTAVVQMDS